MAHKHLLDPLRETCIVEVMVRPQVSVLQSRLSKEEVFSAMVIHQSLERTPMLNLCSAYRMSPSRDGAIIELKSSSAGRLLGSVTDFVVIESDRDAVEQVTSAMSVPA